MGVLEEVSIVEAVGREALTLVVGRIPSTTRSASREDSRMAVKTGCPAKHRAAWSGWRESNPRDQLGRLELYH